MTWRPVGRAVRAVVPTALCAALALGPLWGVQPAGAITPEQATAAGYIPTPAPALARITIDEISPRVLDGAGGTGQVAGGTGQVAVGTEAGVPVVTVSGTITNVGELPLESVDVRLQRGPRTADSDSVRDPLVWSEPSFGVRGEFLRVAEAVAPGESVPYRVSMPAREIPGAPAPDLQLTEPGIYPLLVNVNGTPEGGSPARLDDARTLLPVLEAPRPAALPGGDDGELGAPEPADGPGPAPVPLTMLWPLASAPTRIATVPGADGPDPVVALTDDSLLRELAEDGRLTGLVRAADDAFDGAGGQELRRAVCLAVDPDLLGTVSEIAGGRSTVIGQGIERDDSRASTGRRGDDGSREKRGPEDPVAVAADAERWLGELRALAEGGCVVTLPAAQSDLEAVAAVGSTDLTRAALDSADSVERILGTAPVPDTLVPASGTLLPGTAEVLTEPGATAIVAAPSTRTDTGLVPPPGIVGLAGTEGGRALTYSAAVGSALAATGSAPENPRYSDPDTRYWLTADSTEARLQDARATLLAPIVDAIDSAASPVPGAPLDPASDQGVLAVPPQVWTIGREAAGSVLEALGAQLAAGRMRAVPLAERLAGPVTIPDGYLADDPTGAADPGAMELAGADPIVADALRGLGTLRSLVDTSDPTSAGAQDHLDPIVGDALRALSETGRRAGGDGTTPESGTGDDARSRTAARLERLEQTVAESLDRVDLLPPGSVFTMASPNSPLLLVTRNALPFPVRVGITVTAPPDIRVEPVGVVQIPASGSRTLQVPTQSDAEGGTRHTVAFVLEGPDGRPLSEPVELSVQTGGYPVAQAFALFAAALALALGGRRYLRYRRGILDPADEGHRP
ncbi:hypothetical protein [Dietzia sp. ANT_WB102]|uniref:hypothetical protein n=1 Tax=Dietzia sp. ANT_WB102 TaxID=2597345 RepID=UPI0011ED3DD9|nr:hypothetical protein [Dietzia sp. ANT_WB102]KAA0918279.1 hypothetical protein FQ137_02630 [Dietzia sp. ANT_WB102]